MEEELKQKLIEYVEATGDFVTEQAPLVAQEMLYFGKMQGALYIIATLMVIVLTATASAFFFRMYKDNEHEEGWVGIGIISAVISTTCFFAFVAEFLNNIQPWIAPRLYLLKEIGDIL